MEQLFVPRGDDFDRLRRRVLWSMPTGLYVVGSRWDQNHNAMTLNWASQVSIQPKLLAISVINSAFTHELISQSGIFSLNIISREDRSLVRRFVKPANVDLTEMTLNGFGFHHGQSGAPILDQAVAFLDCEVRHTLEVGDHTLFVGEVVDAGFQRQEDTPTLRMEDTRMNYGG